MVVVLAIIIITDIASIAVEMTNSDLDSPPAEAKPEQQHADDHVYPPFRTVLAVMAALYIAMFLVSLDKIIIATALPQITNRFHSIDDIGWYGSAYVFAGCSTQILFGRLYAYFHNKTVFLAAIVLFEAGSALCGGAPTSGAFIAGRVIAGAGSAGVFAGAIVLMVPLVPLHQRALYQGLLGAIFGISSVIGPLIGGAFTNNHSLTWRWCFYINLPIGGASVFLVLLFLRGVSSTTNKEHLSKKEMGLRMDPVGSSLFIAAVSCLLLALAWGGSTYAWNSGRIIALLVLSGVIAIVWFLVENLVIREPRAAVPFRLLRQRSIAAALAFSTCVGGTLLSVSYYMAVWFQAIQGVDALQSGIHSLPMVLAVTAASIISGGTVNRTGYYTPSAIVGACLLAIGIGLLTTLHVGSRQAAWVGFQFIAGFGLGCGMQMPGMAAQTVLPAADVPMGTSLMFFGQNLGGAVFLCVAQNVFLQQLVRHLREVLPAASVQVLAGVGATDLRQHVSSEDLPKVLHAYNKALTTTFYVPLALACFAVVPACCLEFKSVKRSKGKGKGEKGEKGANKEDTEKGKETKEVDSEKA